MKKTLLSLLMLAGIGYAASAQTSKPVTFGVKAGVAFPSMSISAGGTSIGFDSKTSFYVGGTAEFALSDIISIQPGLSFIGKGSKLGGETFDFEESDLTNESATLNLNYLELPVNVLANFKVNNAGKVFIGAGPYFAYALSGNVKYGSEKEIIEFDSNDGIKRGEFGLNFLAGFQFNNKLNIHAGYGLGLSSVIDEPSEVDVKFKNKVFSVGLGYSF